VLGDGVFVSEGVGDMECSEDSDVVGDVVFVVVGDVVTVPVCDALAASTENVDDLVADG
jgi:phosphoketolase